MPSPTVLDPIYADLHFRGVAQNGRAAAANMIPAPSYSPVRFLKSKRTNKDTKNEQVNEETKN